MISNVWLLPVSWLIHDVEEFLLIERQPHGRQAGRNEPTTPLRTAIRAMATNRRQFAVAVVFVGCIVVAATIAGTFDPRGYGMVVYSTALAGYFLHAFIHIARSMVFRAYTPGVVTAVVVVIPVSLGLYWWLFESALVDTRLVITTGFFGLSLFVPVVVVANRLSSYLMNNS